MHKRIVISFAIMNRFSIKLHGLPSNKEQACVGTISQSTKSEYVPIVKCTRTVLVTLILRELSNHWMQYECGRCLVGSASFSTMSTLARLLQLPPSMMIRIALSLTTPRVWNRLCVMG